MPQFLPASLKRRRPGRIRPQLDGLQTALEELGNPQTSFPSILIVGTNGKGSTAAMVESILSAHGMVVGLYTSPHLVHVEERIRVGGAAISLELLEAKVRVLDRFGDLTFFETVTAAAFLAFAETGVDCAVLEAGMGGRWDATRLAASEIAGLTNVGSDHRGWLGERAEERAADKGAALMAARRRVLGAGVDPAIETSLGSGPFTAAGDLVSVAELGGRRIRLEWDSQSAEVQLPFAGNHQVANCQLAVGLARLAQQAGWVDDLRSDAIREGLARTHWPGRLSTHRIAGRRVLVDCAHNAEGAQALAEHLHRGSVLYHLLFSCLEDKPVEEMAERLRPHVGNIVIYQLDDERAMPIHRLQRAFPEADTAVTLADGLSLLPSPVVAAGSVRAVGGLLAMAEEEVDP
jgi:dihydrofolate synthase/folylpolyglutamate synthase